MSTVIDGTLSGDVVDRIQTNTKQVFIAQEQKPNGTAGGTFTDSAWRTRELSNVLINTIAGASLDVATFRVTLPAGTYLSKGFANAYSVNRHRAKIANITDTSDAVMGLNSESQSSATAGSTALVSGPFTISGTKVFELQHLAQTTKAGDGFGRASTFSGLEILAQIEIEKIG
jgi:hypothetical protein